MAGAVQQRPARWRCAKPSSGGCKHKWKRTDPRRLEKWDPRDAGTRIVARESSCR